MATVAALPLTCQPVFALPDRNERRISRVPCKARGTFNDHNAWNAYIDIPATAVHGSELACSHKACAASGRRFRFCALCALPVAHRNFVKRHGHGMIGPRGQHLVAPVVKEEMEEERLPKKSRVQNITEQEAKETCSSATISPAIPRMVLIPIVPSTSHEPTAQERTFLELMKTRPVDHSPELSLWIQRVLDVTSRKAVNTPAAIEGAGSTCDAFLDPLVDEEESYEKDQLHDVNLEEGPERIEEQDADDCSSIGSAFLNEMVGV